MLYVQLCHWFDNELNWMRDPPYHLSIANSWLKHFTLDTSRSVSWITAVLNWQWTDRLTLHQIYGKMRYIKAETIVVLLIGYISHKQLFFFVCTRNPKWWLYFKGRFRNDLFVYHTDYGWALIAVLTLFLNHSNGFWSPTEIGFQYHHTWTTIMNSWHSDQLLWN